MTDLMVTPWAPYRDGIASYAQQEVRHLRSAGRRVEVVSPVPSAAHHHLPLGGPYGAGRLVRMASAYDRVIIQFFPELMFGRCRTTAERLAVWTALAGMARTADLELRIHEIQYDRLESSRVEASLARSVLAAAGAATVHTTAERQALVQRLGSEANAVTVVDHGRNFATDVDITRDQARDELGLAEDELILLCIGFLQHHKGFDLAVEALARADLAGARLDIVGSSRIDHPEIADYVDRLRTMAERSANVTLHEGYVSDELFDRWLLAADVVVLPYREIWSSGVVERARLFDKPIIAADLPQLRDQLPTDALVCDGVPELATAMITMATRLRPDRYADSDRGPSSQPVTVSAAWQVDRQTPDQADLQRQIRHRAASDPRAGSASAVSGALPPRLDRTTAGAVTVGGKTAGLDPGLSDPGEGDNGSTGPDPLPVSRHLDDLGPYQRPSATSARPVVGHLKHSVEILTNWQLDPLTRRVEDQREATMHAVTELEARLRRLEAALSSSQSKPTTPVPEPAPSVTDRDGTPAREPTPQDQPCEYSSPVASASSARPSFDS